MPTEFAPWLGVFETLRVVQGVPLFVRQHAAELHRSASALGLQVNRDVLQDRAKLAARSGRWRWVVTPAGTRTLFVPEKAKASDPIEISLSPVRVGSQNWDARFKTVSYLAHAQALSTATTPEVILLNEHRHIAGAARANLFWRRGERLFTPAHDCGCRRGIVRGFILGRRGVEEGSFPFEDLFAAEEIFLTNSMKGIVSIRSIEGRALGSFSAADLLRAEYAQAVRRQVRSGST